MKATPTAKQAQHLLLPHWAAARVRLGVAAVIGVAASLVVPHHYGVVARMLAGWDVSALVFLLLIFRMMAAGTPESMRRRAAVQDAGRWAILLVIVAGSLFSLAALIMLQARMKSAVLVEESGVYVGLIAATILLSWSFAHAIFALHYAHEYYGTIDDPTDEDGLVGGLRFPSEKQPDYWDFMYFSFVVGMTCQVSDVEITDRGLRRLALVHGVVSFFFNTIILALTINVAASLI